MMNLELQYHLIALVLMTIGFILLGLSYYVYKKQSGDYTMHKELSRYNIPKLYDQQRYLDEAVLEEEMKTMRNPLWY